MKNNELNKLLIEHFPQLSQEYNDEVSWQEDNNTGSHTVYGDILTPYLVNCILQNDRQQIVSIFNFLEKLLCINDQYVDEVISLSVFESIIYLFIEKPYLSEFLGKQSKKVLKDFS